MNGLSALKASYHTLGCKLNFAETSAVSRSLREAGVVRIGPGEKPDICVVNTCSVTETADKKGRQLIRRLASRYPEATIVVTGCYAQLKPAEVAELPHVAIVLGSNDKLRAAEFVEQWIAERRQRVCVADSRSYRTFMPSCERGDRTRYFLKVQDGCDYWCTYCTIPMARGRSRSGRIEDLAALARRTVAEGGREIVITGVNTGDFGKGTDSNFFDLIRALDAVEGIDRYRISSIEPNLLTDDMIRWIARESRAFMPHFHIPLQAGSDAVLKLMRRRYATDLFRERIELIRSEMPDAFVGVDVIAGARGETGEEFERGVEFIASLPVQQLHVFPYSERPGTRALELDACTVPQDEKHRRVERLMALSAAKYTAFVESQTGKERPVLWEQPHAGAAVMHGFTDNYLRVEAPYDERLVNSITPTRLAERIAEDTLRGEILAVR